MKKSEVRLSVVEGPKVRLEEPKAFSNTVQLRLFRGRPAPGSVVSLRVERSLVKVSARNEVLTHVLQNSYRAEVQKT